MIKILSGLSAVMNALLLMFLFGPMPFFLFLSTTLLVASGFYIFHLLGLRKEMAQEVENLLNRIYMFSDYMGKIYQLEAFYGDETIKEMIDESKKLMNDFCDFEENFLDRVYEEETEDDETEDNGTEDGGPEENRREGNDPEEI